MTDKDMADIVDTLIEQNKAVMEMIKFQYDINETPGPSNLAKRPSKNPAIKFTNKSYQVEWFLFQGCPSWPPLWVVGLRRRL